MHSVEIVLDEPVGGLDVGDLILSRDGGGNLLVGTEPLDTVDNVTWTLGNLADLTDSPGTYTLTLGAADSGVADASGNLLQSDAADSWALESGSRVEGRHIFYNRSSFDGDDPAANAGDDDAVAPDKQALMPGPA